MEGESERHRRQEREREKVREGERESEQETPTAREREGKSKRGRERASERRKALQGNFEWGRRRDQCPSSRRGAGGARGRALAVGSHTLTQPAEERGATHTLPNGQMCQQGSHQPFGFQHTCIIEFYSHAMLCYAMLWPLQGNMQPLAKERTHTQMGSKQ